MKTNLKLPLLLHTLLSLAGFAHAQGTAIGYQGRLNDGTKPATGLYDFNFKVFGVEAGGGALAGTVVRNAVPTTNGVFSVSLDFGASVFTGAARWLDISVRTNGVGALVILAPRTPLLPTPYALFAGGVANGTVTASQLSTVGPGPAPGQFLSYNTGGNLAWMTPGVAAGNTWLALNGSAYYNEGKVGIGTDSPISKLHVISGASDLPLRLESSGTSGFGAGWDFYHGAIGKGFVGVPDAAAAFAPGELLMFGGPGTKVSLWPGGVRSLTLDTTGYVGIGTAAPQDKLHLYDPMFSVSHRIETGGFDNSWSRVEFANANGQWNVGTSRGFNSDEFFIHRQGLLPNTFALDASGFAARFSTADLYLGHASRRGLPGRALVDYAVPGGPQQLVINFANDWAETYIGGNKTTFAGDVSVRTITIRGADVAEPFDIDELDLPKGTVVVIDATRRGGLKRSTAAYDTSVAGIVSGANGVDTGIILSQPGVNEGGQNVALSGRVYVQADATFGAIKPGDLLTTSNTPGHAMKVTEHGKAQGAILGKAMSELKTGQGMVLVLVTLQ